MQLLEGDKQGGQQNHLRQGHGKQNQPEVYFFLPDVQLGEAKTGGHTEEVDQQNDAEGDNGGVAEVGGHHAGIPHSLVVVESAAAQGAQHHLYQRKDIRNGHQQQEQLHQDFTFPGTQFKHSPQSPLLA